LLNEILRYSKTDSASFSTTQHNLQTFLNPTAAKGISVIIPNFNGEKVLKFSLTSLANQTFPKEMYEIIVVDNASLDNSLKIVEEIRQIHKDCDIRIIRLKKNFGYGRAVNIGALHAKFNLILASNNDIIFHFKYLENLYKVYSYARSINGKIVAAQGLHMYFPEVLCIYNAGGLLSVLTGHYRFYGKCLTKDDFLKIIEWVQKERIAFSYIAFPNGAGALIEKEAFLKAGGYYRLYFSGVEEIDLGLLLHLLGYRIVFAPSAILYHMESYTLGERSILVPHKLYMILTGLFVYMLSLYDPLWLLKSLIVYVLTILSILILSITKRMKTLVWVIIKTMNLNIRMKKAILIRRSRIMKIKKANLSEIFLYLKTADRYVKLSKLLASLFSRYL